MEHEFDWAVCPRFRIQTAPRTSGASKFKVALHCKFVMQKHSLSVKIIYLMGGTGQGHVKWVRVWTNKEAACKSSPQFFEDANMHEASALHSLCFVSFPRPPCTPLPDSTKPEKHPVLPSCFNEWKMWNRPLKLQTSIEEVNEIRTSMERQNKQRGHFRGCLLVLFSSLTLQSLFNKRDISPKFRILPFTEASKKSF